MKSYLDMTKQELAAELQAVGGQYAALKAVPRSLNMARGKPIPPSWT